MVSNFLILWILYVVDWMREPEHEFKSKREQIPEQERQRILTDLLRVVNKPEKAKLQDSATESPPLSKVG